MATNLHICFDLGSDTLKVVYAYRNRGVGPINFGKFMFDDLINQSAIPGTAYYDEDKETWLYADMVEDGKVKNFVNTVKIKQLLSLVRRHRDEEVFRKNKEYYERGNLFPKYYFPVPVALKDVNDFELRVKKNMVFESYNWTPKKVCEEYFKHICKLVNRKKEELGRAKNLYFDGVELAIVYPPKSGTDYVNELKRIIQKTFGKPVGVSMITTKALSLYAMNRGLVPQGEEFIVFDMGETTTSVVKAKLTKTNSGDIGIAVEGSDGHLSPIEIGGTNLDNHILSFLEGQIRERETIGTASYGDEGHISESGVHAKQFLLVKNIKKAKMILSKEPGRKNIFKDGVPISIHRDVRINRIFTKDQLHDVLLNYGETSIANKLKDYIFEELLLPINRNVKTVFIAGGLIETDGLLEFIEEEAKKHDQLRRVTFKTFEAKSSPTEMYPIKAYEDSTFAAAIGGAITSLMNYSYETCLSLSYGTWCRNESSSGAFRNEKYFTMFDSHYIGSRENMISTLKNAVSNKVFKSSQYKAEKGKSLPLDGISFFTDCVFTGNVSSEELYSVNIDEAEMKENIYGRRGNLVDHDNLHIYVGEDDTTLSRRKLSENYQLKVVAGGNKASIGIYYKDVKVKLTKLSPAGSGIKVFEGISMDCDGFAIPFVVNAEKNNSNVLCSVKVVESKNGLNENALLDNIPASQLEFRFDGVDAFDN